MTEKIVDIGGLSDDQKRALLADVKRIENTEKFNKLALYKPYPFQHEFHTLEKRWRMLMAPNRSGKTYSAAAEVSMHLTGRYPDSWVGKRFGGPINAWVCGTDFGQMKGPGACHALLMGETEIGTGLIPAADLESYNTKPGVPGMYTNIRVKHKAGGLSILDFKAYNQGRAALQGSSLDVAWMDEEPTAAEQEAGIVSEIVTRLNDRKGILMITYTPLEGETALTNDFYPEVRAPELRGVVQVGADRLPHMSAHVDDLKKMYRPHEWRARIYGLPALGTGAIFPFTEDCYVVQGFALPTHTRYIFGLDYGINHPTAAVLAGWVEDTDTVYVTAEYTLRGNELPEGVAMPPIVASWFRRTMPGAPVAWPHDMSSREKGTGKTGQLYYKQEGLNMCQEHAQYPDDRKNGLEDSIDDIRGRIETGRFKIFASCTQLIGEMQTYHRKNNKPVDIKDDLIAAARYATMSLRFSRTTERIGLRRTPKPQKPGSGFQDRLGLYRV